MNNNSVPRFFYKYARLRGFTLIELLVVLGILGILSAVLLAAINPIAQLQKSHDARRKADLESIQHALELYYQDKGTYPVSQGDKIKIGPTVCSWGAACAPFLAYMPKLPIDPSAANNYVYYSTGGQSYYLYANIERGKNDPQVCVPATGAACASISSNSLPATACGGTCNYGVSSSNVSP